MTFDRDDVLFLKGILKNLVGLREFSIASAKYFHSLLALNQRLNLIGKETQSDENLKARIAELEKEHADYFFSNADKLRDVFAKMESESEQLEAWMAELDKVFPDPLPPAQPASGA